MNAHNEKNAQSVDTRCNQIVSSNPFLASIEEFLSTENLGQRMASSPLKNINTNSLSLVERIDFLDRMQEEYFEPLSTSMDIAIRIYRLIRRGYINRDPTKPLVRKMNMKIASKTGQVLSEMPWFSTYAKGMTISGITGLGKSHEVKRALSLLPRRIDHGRSHAAGWEKLTQAVWLYIGMSHDGSIGGLLLQILCELDDVLGTSYSQDRAILRLSNEKLAVKLGIIFRNHGVGILVIDEIQERNFVSNGHGKFTATFVLRLLNFGIPVVLIGNPFGFEALYSFSQDVRRIGSGGSIRLHPLEKDDFDWKKCMAPAISSFNVMPEQYQIDNLDDLLFQYSGGIRDFACRVHIAAQKNALDLGDLFINEHHLIQAYGGSDFSDKEREIIVGFRDKNPIPLIQYEDIPWEEYSSHWNLNSNGSLFSATNKNPVNSAQDVHRSSTNEPGDSNIKKSNKSANNDKSIPVPQKVLSNVIRQRTRKENSKNKRAALNKTLGSNDMRVDGLKEYLISGFDSLLSEKGKE